MDRERYIKMRGVLDRILAEQDVLDTDIKNVIKQKLESILLINIDRIKLEDWTQYEEKLMKDEELKKYLEKHKIDIQYAIKLMLQASNTEFSQIMTEEDMQHAKKRAQEIAKYNKKDIEDVLPEDMDNAAQKVVKTQIHNKRK